MAVGSETDNMDDDDENAFIMERSLGYMAMTKELLLPESHENEFEPSEYPSYRPWLSDTATSYTMCSERSAMVEYHEYGPNDDRPHFETSNGEIATAMGYGKCLIQLDQDNGSVYNLVVDCQYNPNISCNVFGSHICMKDLGLWVKCKDNTIRNLDTDEIVGYTYTFNKLPYLKTISPVPITKSYKAVDALREHRRFAHCGQPKLKATVKAAGDILQNTEFHCEPCRIAKAKRQVSHTPQIRSKNIWDLYHADVQTIKPIGFGGYKYYVIYVNDKHRVPEIDFLRNKGEASDKLISFCKRFKNLTGRYPTRWRLDGGLEFKRFTTWAKKKGITLEPTPPRSPEPNGVAERWGGYLNETARAMIIDSELPPTLWPFAIDTAAYTIKRIVNPGEKKSPLQAYREDLGHPEVKASISTKHLQIWGTRCYKHIPKEDRVQAEKMGPRAVIGHLVGYEGDNGHIYQIWIPEKNKVVRSRDVSFSSGESSGNLPVDDNEDPTAGKSPKSPPDAPDNGDSNAVTIDLRVPKEANVLLIEDAPYTTGRLQTLSQTPEVNTPIRTIEDTDQTAVAFWKDPLTATAESTRTSSRSTKGLPPKRLEDEQTEETRKLEAKQELRRQTPAAGVMSAVAFSNASFMTPRLKIHEIKVPGTYREAISSPQKNHWVTAMDNQIAKLEDKGTYEMVDCPKDVKLLPGKWVFDTKTDTDNFITEWRARWVVCGNRQRPEKDFDTTYAPVVTESATKLVLSAIAIMGLYAEQVDFVTAYLNAQLKDKKLYMRPPTGYEPKSRKVCLLSQALYGLRQSAFLWNKTLDEKLRSMGFKPLTEDPCVYIRQSSSSFTIIYVDDAIIAAPTKEEVDEIKRELNKDYPIKELGEPNKFLGCHLTRDYDNNTIILAQASYIDKILVEAGLSDCYPTKTPITPNYLKDSKLDTTTSDIEEYLHTVGQFNWLTTKTRPDIAYAVSRLQRKSAKPNITDMKACKSLLRYLKGQKYLGIALGVKPHEGLAVYVDSSHADNDDGKSTESYLTTFAGAPISWASKKQTFVATSSTIAEFCALTAAVKEAIWLKKLTVALKLERPGPVIVYCDSSNALDIVSKPGYSSTTKWVDNRYFFVRDAVNNGLVEFKWIDGKINPADGLTKPLDSIKHANFRSLMGMMEAEKDIKEPLENLEEFEEGIFVQEEELRPKTSC